MKHKVLSKIISMALIPAMLLSTASCGKKTYGKTARKIASEEPWDATTFDDKEASLPY